ncbi:anhydro-N-acetylmuramic acid kinase [Oxalobacter paraformigenes]|uniref:Anhydro-N-acetylmuramic acid kinase n=1 Tax=Oxalobacter paraformigenes TaxID=556268 RepID=C3X4Y4_9BURK|nr:anhydro-N-acetylmuramic acid kinase [Oxalobacter paraformigenes]EEO28270.1 hypothetical protein OFAG_01423 [Oxalobacter paraformigenes]
MALFIGLMSGTSLDGVDGVLASLPDSCDNGKPAILSAAHVPFDLSFRKQLMELQTPGSNEIEREALAANRLASLYAENVRQLLLKNGTSSLEVRAIGVHGQTIRHRPDLGFTRQTNNPALLAELTGIDVIADFRSRDIAAGGQGAPLVPAFHQAVFGDRAAHRVVVNIGGIANISILHPDGSVSGFDTGPGNVLLDAWIQSQRNQPFDIDGNWGRNGTCSRELLKTMQGEPFFSRLPPKSTGRDLFHLDWLREKLLQSPASGSLDPADVQATLTMLTASSVAQAIRDHACGTEQIYVCGGGARNRFLMILLEQALQDRNIRAKLASSEALGIDPMHVESLAFAWLAHRFIAKKPGNLPPVTGAKSFRILGALYPA